jgi:hypothetical protein
MYCENERGKVNLIIDNDRTESPTFQAAMNSSFAENNSGSVSKVEAQGIFKQRHWKSREGEKMSVWEFHVSQAKISGLDNSGNKVVNEIGFPVREMPAAEKSASAEKNVEKSIKKEDTSR